MPLCEQRGVVLVMELLNSRVNHHDYMCDKSAWGIELCKQVGSDNFKLLYDIYHMQIMEGDVIATIRRDHAFLRTTIREASPAAMKSTRLRSSTIRRS